MLDSQHCLCEEKQPQEDVAILVLFALSLLI